VKNKFQKLISLVLIVGIISTSFLNIAEAEWETFSKDNLNQMGETLTRSASRCTTKFIGRVASQKLLNLAAKLISTDVVTEDTSAMFREAFTECLSGVAIGIAKDFLTSITRDTFDWIKNGFNGYNNGFIVSNMNALLNNIENTVMETEILVLENATYSSGHPYGKDFARGEILEYQNRNLGIDSLKTNMSNFLSGDKTVFDFAEDFSAGGEDPWDSWVSLTQYNVNNRLGFSLMAKDYISQIKEEEKQKLEKEIELGNGFLPQKDANVCEIFGWTRTSGEQKQKEILDIANTDKQIESLEKNIKELENSYRKAYEDYLKAKNDSRDKTIVEDLERYAELQESKLQEYTELLQSMKLDYDKVTNNAKGKCTKYKTITPGSIIKEQLTKTVTSPQTQLELADSIDDALTTLLDSLLDNIFHKGIVGFSEKEDTFETVSIYLNEDGERSAKTSYFKYKDLGNEFNSNGVLIKRGIIQIQKDYNAEIPKAIENNTLVSPALGKLDYCIPGPNPSWEENTQKMQYRLQELAGDPWGFLSGTSKTPKMAIKYMEDYYKDEISLRFGEQSPLQKPTKGKESEYLPMMKVGLEETRDMVSTINSSNAKIDKYNTESVQIDINLKELNKIKDGINSIIISAQKRRDAESVKNGEEKASEECLWSERINLEYYGSKKIDNGLNNTGIINTNLTGETFKKPDIKSLR
jgi:hypothetical protein